MRFHLRVSERLSAAGNLNPSASSLANCFQGRKACECALSHRDKLRRIQQHEWPFWSASTGTKAVTIEMRRGLRAWGRAFRLEAQAKRINNLSRADQRLQRGAIMITRHMP